MTRRRRIPALLLLFSEFLLTLFQKLIDSLYLIKLILQPAITIIKKQIDYDKKRNCRDIETHDAPRTYSKAAIIIMPIKKHIAGKKPTVERNQPC